MNDPFSQQSYSTHKQASHVFVEAKNEHQVDCRFFQAITFQAIPMCHKKAQERPVSQRFHKTQPDMTATKLSKKSLKGYTKMTDHFQNPTNSLQYHKIETQPKTQHHISNSAHQLSRNGSKNLSKTTSSELGYAFVKKPAVVYSQVSSIAKHSYKGSSQNLTYVSFQNAGLKSSGNYSDFQGYSNVPMVESINPNTVHRSMNGLSFSAGLRPVVNPQVFGFSKNKFVPSFPPSLQNLGISPVKQITIPQVSEYSCLNSHNPTERQQMLTRKSAEWKAFPNISKQVSEEYSDFIKVKKTPQKASQKIVIKQSIGEKPIHENSAIMICNESQTKLQASERPFLQISFDEKEEVEDHKTLKQSKKEMQTQSEKNQQVGEKIQNLEESRCLIASTSSKIVNQSQLLQLQNLKQSLHNDLQSHTQSDNNKPLNQTKQTDKNKQTIAFKTPRLQHISSGRHSVQLPKSKKFSGMKVRRTISMRDQQDSQSEETSQVIYGFRQTHKQAIAEEIDEGLQESRMHRPDMKLSDPSLNSLRQLPL